MKRYCLSIAEGEMGVMEVMGDTEGLGGEEDKGDMVQQDPLVLALHQDQGGLAVLEEMVVTVVMVDLVVQEGEEEMEGMLDLVDNVCYKFKILVC